IFLFSSRRRHTRSKRDWSSDVCSSDLFYFVHSYGVQEWELHTDGRTRAPLVHWSQHEDCGFVSAVENGPLWATQFHPEKSGDARSEERRVGKERRDGRTRCRETNKNGQ